MSTSPYIVAEISGNHNGDIAKALKLIEEIKKAGANAIKLQTYTADTITIDESTPDFMINDGLWNGYTLYDLYQKAHTPWEWHEALFKKAKELAIDIFSTPFDETAVDFLENLLVPLYKVASFEITHIPLIAYIAKTGKPMIMSTGTASLEEISDAVNIAQVNGCKDITLLHCVSEYPTPPENYNLRTMLDLKERFPTCNIGLSDHTLGTTVAVAAAALGANVIEKHVTLSRSDEGVDVDFSLEPNEFKQLCTNVREAFLSIGQAKYRSRSANEEKNRRFRRSIYAVKDIRGGDLFSTDNVRVIRPGYGLAPRWYGNLIGKTASRDISRGTALNVKDVKEKVI